MEVEERPGLVGSAYAAADAVFEAAQEAAEAHAAACERLVKQQLEAQQAEYTEQVLALTRLIARQTELTGARRQHTFSALRLLAPWLTLRSGDNPLAVRLKADGSGRLAPVCAGRWLALWRRTLSQLPRCPRLRN